MVMKRLLVLLSLAIVIKVANSEWVLGVHVQHFQNPYNVEFRDGRDYCCCDISAYDLRCEQDLTDLNVTLCVAECEPYFETHLEVCFANGTCSYMKNEIACIGDIPSTCISPLLGQLHLNESMIDNITNATLYVDVLDSPADEGGVHIHVIDNFTVPIPGNVSNCVDQFNSLTVQGILGIGNLTLAFLNLTTDSITDCNSADDLMSTTSSQNPNRSCECSSSPTSMSDEADGERSTAHPVWTTLAILFLLVALTFAAISAVLGFIVYRTREDVNTWLSSKLTRQREHTTTGVGLSTDEANDNEGEECQHVYSIVDKKKKNPETYPDEPSYMNTETTRQGPRYYDEDTQNY